MSALADYTAALADESTTAERWDAIAHALGYEAVWTRVGSAERDAMLAGVTDSHRRATSLRLTAERQRAEQIGEGFAALEVR